MAATKMIPSLNCCCVLKRWRCRGQKRWLVILAIPGQWLAEVSLPFPPPQLCSMELLWQLICHDWEDNFIAFKKQIRGFLFRMLPPAGLLISRDGRKNISENRWANLLQVRLSGSCYVTHRGRLGNCWGWVGRGRTDGKLRAWWATDVRKTNSFRLHGTHALWNDGLRKLELWAFGVYLASNIFYNFPFVYYTLLN